MSLTTNVWLSTIRDPPTVTLIGSPSRIVLLAVASDFTAKTLAVLGVVVFKASVLNDWLSAAPPKSSGKPTFRLSCPLATCAAATPTVASKLPSDVVLLATMREPLPLPPSLSVSVAASATGFVRSTTRPAS